MIIEKVSTYFQLHCGGKQNSWYSSLSWVKNLYFLRIPPLELEHQSHFPHLENKYYKLHNKNKQDQLWLNKVRPYNLGSSFPMGSIPVSLKKQQYCVHWGFKIVVIFRCVSISISAKFSAKLTKWHTDT